MVGVVVGWLGVDMVLVLGNRFWMRWWRKLLVLLLLSGENFMCFNLLEYWVSCWLLMLGRMWSSFM